jgi:hypothetical protein
MGSFRHPKQYFDPLDLEIMERALNAAWRHIKAYKPVDNARRSDEELKSFLAEKLVAIATVHGVSDPETLRSLLLGGSPLVTALPQTASLAASPEPSLRFPEISE